MRRVDKCKLFLGLVVSVLAGGVPALGVTFSLKAVAINGQSIQPTGHILARPGDLIECEMWITDFADLDGIRLYHFTIDPNGHTSGDTGVIRLLGLDAPMAMNWSCDTAEECTLRDEVSLMHCYENACQLLLCDSDLDCPGDLFCDVACMDFYFDHEIGYWIQRDHPRYIFKDVPHIDAVVPGLPNASMGGMTLTPNVAPSDNGQPYYGGSIALIVSDASDQLGQASGRFTFDFVLGEQFSWVVLPSSLSDIVIPNTEPLIVDVVTDAPGTMGACCRWNRTCEETTGTDCRYSNGSWHRGWSCESPELECTFPISRFPRRAD